MGFFPVMRSVKFLRMSGRSEELCSLYEAYYRLRACSEFPQGEVDYSQVVELDLAPSALHRWPKRPQDRVILPEQRIFNAL